MKFFVSDLAVGSERAAAGKDIAFLDVHQKPFALYGLCDSRVGESFRRLPKEVARASSARVEELNYNTTGGRLRFSTDSDVLVIRARMSGITRLVEMPLSATAGFDLYEDGSWGSRHRWTFLPPAGITDGYQAEIEAPGRRERQYTIYFPLYSGVDELYIGLRADATVGGGATYRERAPILYYGSSITQGGCASRPGNTYEAMISRKLNADYINLGFAGSAKGEEPLAAYMAELPVSAFVCDYDYNAPDAAHLKRTLGHLYEIFRGRQAETPLLLLSHPNFSDENPGDTERRDVVYSVYRHARSCGDCRTYFVDGASLFGGEGREDCTVDGVHPNDLGFSRMAGRIGSALREAAGMS